MTCKTPPPQIQVSSFFCLHQYLQLKHLHNRPGSPLCPPLTVPSRLTCRMGGGGGYRDSSVPGWGSTDNKLLSFPEITALMPPVGTWPPPPSFTPFWSRSPPSAAEAMAARVTALQVTAGEPTSVQTSGVCPKGTGVFRGGSSSLYSQEPTEQQLQLDLQNKPRPASCFTFS